MNKSKDTQLKVFISNQDSTCCKCGKILGQRAWIILKKNIGPICLPCAGLNRLVFLPSGDATLTRRSKKYSNISAIVLKWSKHRKRYERQGILIKKKALEKAEQDCKADANKRAVQRVKSAVYREKFDAKYINRFAARIREMYSRCPVDFETLIAKHACRKYSGRVGRCAAAKKLDKKAVRLAVTAFIRHTQTNYDSLLSNMITRDDARASVQDAVSKILKQWETEISKEKHKD